MRTVLLHLAANAAAILIVAALLPREVGYDSYGTVVVFAIVLGILNAVLTPILNLLTLPLACLTLGLFRIVVNIVVFFIAAALMPQIPGRDLTVTPLGAAVGSLVAGLASGVLTLLLRDSRR